jgi:hypothetical protein
MATPAALPEADELTGSEGTRTRARMDLCSTKDTPNNNCYDFGDCLGLIV